MTLTEQTRLNGILTTAHFDFQKGLHSRAFFKVSNHELGEDLVQQTFLKTWTYLIKGGKIKLMKAFLHHILNNLIVDEYRKHKATSLDTLFEKGFEPKDETSSHVENIFDGKEASLLINNLPKLYVKVMRMKYLQGLSLKEISMITGQSKNATAVQLHRGLQKLKVLYNH